MFSFTKPAKLNGAQLKKELLEKGIELFDTPLVDGDGILWLDIEKDKVSTAQSIVEKHSGRDYSITPTIEEKLASVGLSLDDLKVALGIA